MAQNEGKLFGFIKGAISMIDTYGVFKIVFSCLLMIFISYTTYLTFNPSIMFKRYSEYEAKKHNESFEYRMESAPVVQSVIDNMVIETGALRTFVIEMHNGKYNSSGLSFNYGSLTYEATRDGVESIREDYDDFTLERYPFLYKVYKLGKWSGTVVELMKIDKRLALKLQANNAYYISLSVIYGSKNEIGFIGATFSKDDVIQKNKIENLIYRYAGKIAPYLDGEIAKKITEETSYD